MDNNISRREALKRIAAAAGAVVASPVLTGCGESGGNASTSAGPKAGEGKMTYRKNLHGDDVSILGYGCMRWPTVPDPADPDKQIVDQDAVNSLVDYAIEHGVNYFDTAPPYVQGMSEHSTGIALSRHPRDSYYIATKMSNFFANDMDDPKQILDESIKMYRNSMKELQTDYIDYYLLHFCGGGGMPVFEKRFLTSGVLDFLLKEREAGRIRNLGFSYHGDVKVFDYMLSRNDEWKWDFVQIQLNYSDWKHASGLNYPAEYLYAELEKRGIPAVIMEPLQGGRLATLTRPLNARLKQRRPEDSIASWAFRYAGTPEGVLTVLSGMTYKEHLVDNLRTYSPLEPCTDEELALLEDTAVKLIEYPSVPCTGCAYCMPCPYGINIPAVFAHFNKCINNDNLPSTSADPNYARARRAYLVSYDRSVERLRQADHCIGCGQCKPHCPQTIDIPSEMARIDKYTEKLRQNRL